MALRETARKADTSLALGSGQIMCSLHLRRRRHSSPEIFGGLFGRGWVDEEAGSPFESSYLGQFRDDLEVPVEVIEGGSLERSRMEAQVPGGSAQHLIH